MESEENLSIETQIAENNISVKNSSPMELQSDPPKEKETKSTNINNSENNEKISKYHNDVHIIVIFRG